MIINDVIRTMEQTVEDAIQEHIKQGVPFTECMFRPGSEAFSLFYQKVREQRDRLTLDWQDEELLDTDIGSCIVVEGERVPLDVPIEEDAPSPENPSGSPLGKYSVLNKVIKGIDKITGHKRFPDKKDKDKKVKEAEYQGRKVKLNSPKRGGSKKYYVYVRDPKTKNIKKVSWGDTTGLSTKANNPAAVRSFVARHKCKQKNDKTKAGYWACRTPRYKALGVKGGQWW